MKVRTVVLFLLAAILVGCAAKPAAVKPAPARAMTAPAAPVSTDYLDPGIKIAAVRMVSWEDTAFMAKAYPVKIAQQASAATENKHFVQPVVPVEGEKEAGSDIWKWTPFVFNSRPARKEDLAEGRYVLCVVLERPLPAAELKKAVWSLRKISSTSKLFQNLVEVSYNDTYHHSERKQLVNAANIRIVEDAIDESAMWFK